MDQKICINNCFHSQLQILDSKLLDGRKLFTSYHTKEQRRILKKQQLHELYTSLQVKKVIHKLFQSRPTLSKLDQKSSRDSMAEKKMRKKNFMRKNLTLEPINSINMVHTILTTVSLYGCEKNSKSCIGQVLNRKPFYIYKSRHTPPCCFEKLKTIFHNVIEEMENFGIRYWLDNEALKDAIETNQLSPDAYEIDVSFNYFDLKRSQALKKSQLKPYIDDKGFYWIKATDGNYFKVFFSKINQIGINLLPYNIEGDKFVSANGFYGWKAKNFSLEYLHPMSAVSFLGRSVACPNNVREYIKIKNIHIE